jgi:hypothetical protein
MRSLSIMAAVGLLCLGLHWRAHDVFASEITDQRAAPSALTLELKKVEPPLVTLPVSTHAALADCPEILFLKRHHTRAPFGIGTMYAWDCYSPGGGIYALDPRHPQRPQREIFRRDDGVVFNIELSYDARTILFAWMSLAKDARDSFHIYEIGIDGQHLRQLTTGRYHDVSATYLPDGGICFVSTRSECYSMCQPAPACALFVMNAAGQDLRRIEFSTLGDYSPTVLSDGRILFMRWEYNDRSLFTRQKLWTINPDGTSVRLYYGNTLTSPNVLWQARQIPGSDKVICTMGPHHGTPSGAIASIDQRLGLEMPAAIISLTPSIRYSVTTNTPWSTGDTHYPWAYLDPWPLDEGHQLVAYGGPNPQPGEQGRYRLVLLEPGERRTLLCEDPKYSCFNPIPCRPRIPPPARPNQAQSAGKTGTFILQDVYRGLTGVPRGTCKQLRILSQVPKPCNMRGQRAYDHDPLVGRGTYYVKYNHGTVPVEADGSACFNAPTGVELYFEALDASGKELSRMASLTQIMPGEVQGCVGCHEPRDSSASPGQPLAMKRPPLAITPPPWGAGPVDFVRQVQPVLERYCVRCHSGPDPKGLDLSNDKTRFFNMAYDNLAVPKWVDFYWVNSAGSAVLKPRSSGSYVSGLTRLIEDRHAGVNVDDTSRRAIYAWIDANVPYYGTYANTHPGTAGSRDIWTGPWFNEVTRLLQAGGRLQSGEAFLNLTHPEWSRVLVDHLPPSAGGRGIQPAFTGPEDPDYLAILTAIKRGQKALNDKPRIDMPGATPVPYPTDFGKLHDGFAGP